jgi:hypothetical protein
MKTIWMKTKYYHGTNKTLPNEFKVNSPLSRESLITMEWKYHITDIKNAIFVTDAISIAKTFGSKIYEIESSEEPVMIDNGIYIIQKGVQVTVKRIE